MPSTDTVQIVLLGGFDCVWSGRRIPLPLGTQRLLALLALHDRGAHRACAAERLWPDSGSSRAAGNLRSALWKGRKVADTTVIECLGPRLQMARAVRVDIRTLQHQVESILDGDTVPAEEVLDSGTVSALSQELLPDWNDDWLMLERERWDQVRLHALEGLAVRLLSEGRYVDALTTAVAAIAVEPIRETAHRIVLEIHLAEGNSAVALRHYRRYEHQLQRELGVSPSQRMTELVGALMST